MNFSIYFQSGANIDFYDATPNDISETLQKIGVKFGEPTNNDRLENDVEYFKLKYEKALEQISELDESVEELQACYGEIEKRNDEINEWKQKYENECKHNDVIKKSYDRLAKSFEELIKERDEYMGKYERNKEITNRLYGEVTKLQNERDEWKSKWERRKGNVEAFEELLKERDDAKYLYETTTKAYDELHIKLEETIRELNEYKKIASDRDDLKIALDQANEYVAAVEKSRDEWIGKCESIKEKYMKISNERDDLKIENDKLKTELVEVEDRCATLDQDRFFWKNRWESEFEEGVRLKKELEKWQPKRES